MGFEKLSHLASQGIPCFFMSDFRGKQLEVYPLSELESADIEYAIQADGANTQHAEPLGYVANDFGLYKEKFDAVIEKIQAGETYVLNLTQPTKVNTQRTLKEIFHLANAHYKLRFKDQFVCFSPETFIQIRDDRIHTFPMKGTIDASIENAQEMILSNQKEMAEHVMVVDLLRNDLSMVANKVRVEKFRYVQKIEAGSKQLLQVSSHICGNLQKNWQENFGEILRTLLPAGSISGAPKKSTVEIIEAVEGYERGYFTGVFGIFDGKNVDSGVMIRFIEKTAKGYIYKSGGGITLESDALSEYEESLAKIYLP